MTVLLGILLLYVLPLILTYWYVHILYSKDGAESYHQPNHIDGWLVLCPGLNLIASLAWLVEHPRATKTALFENWNLTWSGFFRIKKK